jgi:hypothetical protein
MSKQDRQAPRTLTDFERRHNFGESFAEVMGVATDARSTANQALSSANNPAGNMTQEEVFNLLTNNGASEGIFKDENGEIYINASYLKTGTVVSADGKSYFNLETGEIRSSADFTTVSIQNGEIRLYRGADKLVCRIVNLGFGVYMQFCNAETGDEVGSLMSDLFGVEIGAGGYGVRFDSINGVKLTCYDQDESKNTTHRVHWKTVNGVKTLVAF